jgi:hypothetical protein
MMNQPPAESAALSEKESAYHYRVFLLCMVLISVPVKNFAYLVPPVYLGLGLLSKNNRGAVRTILLICLAVAVSGLSLMYDSFRGREVNLPGMLLGAVTYLPLFLFVAETYDKPIDEAMFAKLIRVTAWFVIIQSIAGFLQFALSGNPDAVAGVYGLLDFRYTRITIAQVYFTFTLFGAILFLFTDARTRLAKTAIVVGLLACALAQSGHQTIFFAASLGLFGVMQLKRLRMTISAALALALLMAVMVQLYPNTFVLVRQWYGKALAADSSPKRMVLRDGVRILSDEKNMLLGVGMGQFSSRAALITSNQYLTAKLPRPLVGESEYFADSIEPANIVFSEMGEGSAISKPYFSLLSTAVELGVLPSVLLAAALAAGFWRNWRLAHSQVPRVAAVGRLANAGLAFLVLCCTVENYGEFPQAVFMPLLLYLIAVSKAKRDLQAQREGRNATSECSASPPLAGK